MDKIYQQILERKKVIQTEGTSLLFYKPRNSFYYLQVTPVEVKQVDGTWKEYVSYSDILTGKVYARAPEQFDETKWEVLSHLEASKRINEWFERTMEIKND